MLRLSSLFTIISCFMLLLVACQSKDQRPVDQADIDGTKLMADTLDYLSQRIDPTKNYYASNLRAQYYEDKMKSATPRQMGQLMYFWLKELLNDGSNKKAIVELNSFINQLNLDVNNMDKNSKLIFELLALAHLRDGELENCQANHTAESCILPLADNSIHQIRAGSMGAIAIYEKILARFPEDLNSRWLLNIAYVTLGEYPDGVPDQWLIEGLQPAEEGPITPFKNVASGMGLDINELSGSVCTDDFNNDGLLDIFISSWAPDHPLRVFWNKGDGTFEENPGGIGLEGINGGLNLVHADYNNDGFLDVFVMRGAWLGNSGQQPNSLIRNNGDGTFDDVTYEAGVLSFHPTQSASWADFNKDGWIDLFVANETEGDKNGQHPCELFINNQDGTFTEIAKQANIAIEGYFKGCTTGDINGDGFPDVYLSNLNGTNSLLLNTGELGAKVAFKDITTQAKVSEPFHGFPTWMWDYDNDGLLDIFASSYDSRHMNKVGFDEAIQMLGGSEDVRYPRLYKNNGDNTFSDVTKSVGLNRVMFPMGSNFGDLDNDGFLDFYLGTGAPDLRSVVPNLTFYNHRGERFEDITYASGMGHIQKGHGVAFADLDNDGDQDIYTVMGGAYPGDFFYNTLFENSNENNNWITLKLVGEQSNRMAIGARIKVTTLGADGNAQHFFATVGSGGSFGNSSLQQELGLGGATKIERIEVTWPNSENTTQVFTEVPINQRYELKEGVAELVVMESPSFDFKGMMDHNHHHNH